MLRSFAGTKSTTAVLFLSAVGKVVNVKKQHFSTLPTAVSVWGQVRRWGFFPLYSLSYSIHQGSESPKLWQE
jgi:hypothetical protein